MTNSVIKQCPNEYSATK
jgi:hypothetical protein